MRRLEARLEQYTGEPGEHFSRVAQVTFNAWHYSDGDLWASLATLLWDELAKEPSIKQGLLDDATVRRSQLLEGSTPWTRNSACPLGGRIQTCLR